MSVEVAKSHDQVLKAFEASGRAETNVDRLRQDGKRKDGLTFPINLTVRCVKITQLHQPLEQRITYAMCATG